MYCKYLNGRGSYSVHNFVRRSRTFRIPKPLKVAKAKLDNGRRAPDTLGRSGESIRHVWTL